MKKFLRGLFIALTVSLLTCTSAFAMDGNPPDSSEIVAPTYIPIEKTFIHNYYQQGDEPLIMWGLTVGSVTVSIPTTYEETWIVDQNGSKLEFISDNLYFDTSKSMDITDYSSVPYTTVSITNYSFNSSSATVKYTVTNALHGTSSSTVTVYPYPFF